MRLITGKSDTKIQENKTDNRKNDKIKRVKIENGQSKGEDSKGGKGGILKGKEKGRGGYVGNAGFKMRRGKRNKEQ